MKKTNIRMIIVGAALLVLYHLLILTIPFPANGLFWASYLFTLIAFGIAGVSLFIAFRSGGDIKSKFYGLPIAKVGMTYLAVQLVLSFILMALSAYVFVWIGIALYTVALGAAVIGLVATDTVRDHIVEQNIRLKADVATIRSAQSMLNQLAVQCVDSEAAQLVRKLAEELRYCDPVSSPALKEIEAELSATIGDLQQAVVDDDAPSIEILCKKARAVLAERNRLCKLNKSS